MTNQRLHHIGIVLPTLEQVHAFIAQYGLEIERESRTPYQADCIFTKAKGKESPIEFLVPYGGPLKEFNEGKGGMHHICYEVDDIERATRELQETGCKLLERESRTAEYGVKINFVLPQSSFGVLVELMELPKSRAL